MLQSIRAYYMY